MNEITNQFPDNPEIEREAADWAIRLDRGLTAEEQDAYTDWLAEDERHKEAMAMYRWGWDEFDRLAGLQTTHQAQVDPDLLAPGNRFARKSPVIKILFGALPLAAALAIAAILFVSNNASDETNFSSKPAVELIARIEQQALPDGSIIFLNRGAQLETDYSLQERRVRLLRGEANFDVAKDPERPFIVNVAGVDVRAVGTEFNVRLANGAVDVIVSKGIVEVSAVDAPTNLESPRLEVGQRAIMTLGDDPSVDVSDLSDREMDRELGWQPRLLDFDSTPMREIIQAFNRRNEVQLVLEGEAIQSLQLSSVFWSDNVEGFVRLMEKQFDIVAEWRGSTEIVLR